MEPFILIVAEIAGGGLDPQKSRIAREGSEGLVFVGLETRPVVVNMRASQGSSTCSPLSIQEELGVKTAKKREYRSLKNHELAAIAYGGATTGVPVTKYLQRKAKFWVIKKYESLHFLGICVLLAPENLLTFFFPQTYTLASSQQINS